ncbi:Ion channel CASTOR, partial [Durusdinium trenchii]
STAAAGRAGALEALLPSAATVVSAVHLAVFCAVMGGVMMVLRNELSLARLNRSNATGTEWDGAAEADDRKADAPEDEGDAAARDETLSVASSSKEVERIQEQISRTLRFDVKEFAFYRMDYLLSNWASAKPVALLLATYLLIMSGAMLYFSLCDDEEITFGEAVWVSWTFVADPGTHAEERSSLARAVALLLTIGGMLIFALMIGIIADGVSDLLDDLKKGRSRVIESGHTLLLGWSDKVIPTIRELAIANESEGGGVVVLLTERDKEEMEQDLSSALNHESLMGTVVICRSGSPLIMNNLLKVSAQTAKSVIVFSDPEVDADESDARAVRIVMSLTGIHVRAHIVVEMCDVDNRELVHLVGQGMVETVVAHDIIGRLMIQCARQPGLAQILEQLLGFAGDEFYLAEWPCLTGMSFLDASFTFDQAVPIGVKPADPELAARQLQMLGEKGGVLQAAMRAGRQAKPGKSTSSPRPRANPRSDDNSGDSEQYNNSSGNLDGEDPDENEFSDALGYAQDDGGVSGSELSAGSWGIDAGGEPQEEQGKRANSVSSVFGSGPRTMLLNPPDEYIIQEGDQILVIAEDDDSYEASEGGPPSEAAITARMSVNEQHPMAVERFPEKLLFCGWRRDLDDMISELDKLVTQGSELYLMCTLPQKTREKRLTEANKLDIHSLKNLRIIHTVGNPVLRRHLEGLELQEFSSILILADEAFETNMQTADSRSLASLLLIRDIIKRRYEFGGEYNSTTDFLAGPSPLQLHNNTAVYNGDPGASEGNAGSGADDLGTMSPLDEESGSSSNDDLEDLITDIQKGRIKAANASSGSPSPSRKRTRMRRRTTNEQRQTIRRSWCPRNHVSEKQEKGTIIISEILDSRTKSLISVAQVSDYVMSNEIVACAMAMVAEDRAINTVLTELLSASGCEVQVRSCLEYCVEGENLDFWTIMARARKRFEVAIGYKSSRDPSAVVNPRNKAKLRRWHRGDTIVVLTSG